MPRPKKLRFVSHYPVISRYMPADGEPSGALELSVEGLEAIRLSDGEGYDHETAAQRMGVSRQTYGRVLAEARATVARALLDGKSLNIGGGHHCLNTPDCHGRRHRRRGGPRR
ncbi:DUF134 domain-containing protein [Desulfofustis limnaeus]|jgi:predicted DNA-binding protein (UPF0251 family)|uniref:Uncharacterized protein n=1 Tax=Desulfofustis limnaeus TaxID=2740163 RepID=A0ABN6M6J1_9BACT|nr:DUF134 domain-containing protein [Desulfofustis limnaeus]MDX9895909.1 DUF134 domain-containing protein [Desulfofustis sp.]BDD88503.1 hypothetical protein DPPLL_28680 [Desulfofustis limnaeus]